MLRYSGGHCAAKHFLPKDAKCLFQLTTSSQKIGDLAQRYRARLYVAEPFVDWKLLLPTDAKRLLQLTANFEDIGDLDLSYTPPLGSPWEAVQMGAQAWTRQVVLPRA